MHFPSFHEKIDFPEVQRLVAELVGEPCTRKEVGQYRSLSLGFGPEELPPRVSAHRVYRSWELGTYNGTWRVIAESRIIYGQKDSDDNAEHNATLNAIALGRFLGLRQLNELDVRVELDNAVSVDFMPTFSDDDEAFHVFCPGKRVLTFSPSGGWWTGPSDRP